jgi:hypothetical protein
VLCIKFGWQDFKTARWLRRRDPDRQRGRTCAWVYLANGLYKVAGAGLLLLLEFGVLSAVSDRANGQGPDELMPYVQEAALTAFFALVIFSLVAMVGFVRALWSSQKLWVNRRVHFARERDAWPPPSERYEFTESANHVRGLIVAFLVVFLLFLLAFLLASAILVIGVDNAPPGVFVTMSAVSVMIAYPISLLALRDWLWRRLAASIAAECWGAGSLEEVDEARMQ